MNNKLEKLLEKTSNDKIIEYKTCKFSGEKFPIFRGDIDLIEKISPVIGGKKYIYDTPSVSQKIRQIIRLVFRNERNFYNIEIGGKKYISTVHSDMRDIIIEANGFFDTDFTKYNVDKTNNFDKDFAQLIKKVPNIDRLIINAENSPYVNQELAPKDCHLIAGGMHNRDSMYSTFLDSCEDMIDCYSCSNKSNSCYESYRVHNCNKMFYSGHAIDSYNIYFSLRIFGCKNVIFGYDLNNQEYVYKDKVYSKEKWEEIHKRFKEKLKTYSGLKELKKEYDDFINEKLLHGQNNIFCENAIGSAIGSSKNIFYSTQNTKCEDVRYGNILIDVKDSMDVESYYLGERLFNVSSGTDNQNTCAATTHSWGTFNTFYTQYTQGGSNNFGCFGLNNKEYHILNKPYPKEEWEEEVVKIIEEKQKNKTWGEFFDTSLSPYPYNDTVAMEYFPPKKVVTTKGNKIISEKIVDENGVGTVYILEADKFISKAVFDFGGEKKMNIYYRTKQQEINIPEGIDTILAKDLPNSIDDVELNILEKAIICEVSERPFRISKKELDFYKKHGLPLPRLHYDLRHISKLKKLPNRELSVKICEVCKQEKLTNYPDYKNICIECYDNKK